MEDKQKSLEYPINEELLRAATELKESWKTVKLRLERIEENKNKVSKPVYERVLSDYRKKLNEATAQVVEKKKAVDKELVSLYETQKKIASQLETHRHTLEEIKFRNVLEEYSESEYQQRAKEEQDKISKFETVLSAVNTNISRYEELFHDETELFRASEKMLTKEIKESAEISEDDFPDLEEDYFTAPSTTQKDEDYSTLPPQKKKGAAKTKKARIVIISGDEAGGTYPIGDQITFGRAETNTVVLRDAKSSRQHAKITARGDEYVLTDLASSNGTYVNGERIEEYVLTTGDEFQIGDTVIQFQN